MLDPFDVVCILLELLPFCAAAWCDAECGVQLLLPRIGFQWRGYR